MDEQLKKAIAESEEFDKRCGEVLRSALSIESALEFFIENYFVKPQTGKTFFFRDELLVNMGFDKKVQLFKKICKREKYGNKEISGALNVINYIKSFRNKVAHWEAEKSGVDSEIRLRKKAQMTTTKDIWELNDKNMKEFRKKQLEANQKITDIYLKYAQNGTIDEKPAYFTEF